MAQLIGALSIKKVAVCVAGMGQSVRRCMNPRVFTINLSVWTRESSCFEMLCLAPARFPRNAAWHAGRSFSLKFLPA